MSPAAGPAFDPCSLTTSRGERGEYVLVSLYIRGGRRETLATVRADRSRMLRRVLSKRRSDGAA